MSYAQALQKAYDTLSGLSGDNRLTVRLLTDTYDIDLEGRKVLSRSCNAPAKEYLGVILLHYAARRMSAAPVPKPYGEWVSFNQLEGGEGYFPAFKKRTIDVVLRKYGSDPGALLNSAERFNAKRVDLGDAGIVIEPLDDLLILISLSKGDEEFGPDANITFDRNVSQILCTEDVVVLTEFVAHSF